MVALPALPPLPGLCVGLLSAVVDSGDQARNASTIWDLEAVGGRLGAVSGECEPCIHSQAVC